MSKRRVIQEEPKAQMNIVGYGVISRAFHYAIITVVFLLIFCGVTRALPDVKSGVEHGENHVKIWYEAYDSVKKSWEKSSTSYRRDSGNEWLIRELLNQDGVVAWYVENFDDFNNQYKETRVEYAVYNPVEGNWEKGSTSYRRDSGNEWLIRKLSNQDGVVAWHVDNFDSFHKKYKERRVEYAVHDPAKGGWNKGSKKYTGGTIISNLSIQNATIHYSVDGKAYTISFVVEIPDPNLELAIQRNIDKDAITFADLYYITSLSANNVDNLKGIEYCINLDRLYLRNNRITDLSPLAGLTNLKKLDLVNNQVTDLSPLAGLTNLTYLFLGSNHITDLSPLAGLTNLTHLYLHYNQISDLSPLVGLINLKELPLFSNQISDLSPLAGLTNLDILNPGRNRITDLSPLAGLTNLTYLFLNYNQIIDLSPLAGLTNLVRLSFDENQITDLSPLAGLTNLKDLSLRYNQITDISPLVSNAGLDKGDAINLKHNPLNVEAYESHIPALQERGVNLAYNPPPVSYNQPSESVDVNDDGTVDNSDLLLLGNHFGEKGSDVIGDINDDGIVDIFDLVLIGIHFGEKRAVHFSENR